MSQRELGELKANDGPATVRESKYDAEGNFDEYKNAVQKSMEKPYPENGGFYGIGALREMGLRKSRHSGDWRTKSEFRNKEEEFSQPLKGHDTVLEKGITIRGAGGLRLPSTKTGDGAGGAYQEPSGGKASTAQNVALIRGLAKSLALPQSVAARRTFEEELEVLHRPNDFPEWAVRFVYKMFRSYTTPYPAYTYGLARSASTMSSPAVSSRSASSRSSVASKKSAPVVSSALALKVEIIRGEDMPQMDATGIDDAEGCDAYVVLRYDGEERFRTPAISETYSPEWNSSIVIPIPRLSQSLPLVVQVWDEDEVHDELIGQTNVNIITLARGQREERWYTVTAECFKAFRAVQAKTENTHAGRVLMALTLDFAHALQTEAEEEVPDEEQESQIFYKWGIETTSVHEEFDLGRLNLSTASVQALLEARLSMIRDGINVAVKKNLHGAVNSLIKACHYQSEANLYDARMLVEEAIRFAEKELKLLHNDTEDRILACKVAMACTAFKYSDNINKTSEDCKKLISDVMRLPDVVTAVDDELLGSDPDHKHLRSSDSPHCCCTENQPGARIIRHRMLSHVRNLYLAAKEELQIDGERGGAPNAYRKAREGTVYPGPNGRAVDNSLELISCASDVTLRGHFSSVTALCIVGEFLFSASHDKTIRVWSLTTHQCLRVLDLHHADDINCLAASPGRFDMQLFSGAENIKSYNVTQKVLSGEKRTPCIHTLGHHKGAVTCMVTSLYIPPDEQNRTDKGWRLYTGSVDRNIHVYETAFIGSPGINPEDPLPKAVMKGHQSTITTLQVSRGRIFSGSLDTTIMVWCCTKFESLQSLSIGGDIINSFRVIAGRLYVATSDRAILVYDTENMKQVCRLQGHDAYVYCLATHSSALTEDITTLMQNENPMFEMQQRASQPLTFSSYKKGLACKRFSAVTIGIRKAKNLEPKDISPGQEGTSDPFCEVTMGGDVRISGRVHTVKKVQRRTAVLKETLNPRWNETFTFIIPELLDFKVHAGSSVRSVPIQFDVWDWNTTANDFMGTWRGVLGDLMPDVVSKKSRVHGADGTAPPDNGDLGGWVYLEPQSTIVGKDVKVELGLKVTMSDEGHLWMENKNIQDESKGGPGFINKISPDGGMVRVVWQHTIGAEKDGVFHPDGWESTVGYAVGRGDAYHLSLWDDRPRQHGSIMVFCNVYTPRAGEAYPMEPNRTFLYSGSDDETVRVWDLESHTCVSVIKTKHANKVSALAISEAGRLVSASQDSSIKLW